MHLSNFCANLKGSWLHKISFCIVTNTKMNYQLLYLLWVLGYIHGFSRFGLYKLQVRLKIKVNFIKSILQISKPGRRIFCKFLMLCRLIKYNKGIYILSTTKGLLTHKSCLFWHIGGELVCIIY